MLKNNKRSKFLTFVHINRQWHYSDKFNNLQTVTTIGLQFLLLQQKSNKILTDSHQIAMEFKNSLLLSYELLEKKIRKGNQCLVVGKYSYETVKAHNVIQARTNT